jgi:hypothetical protein
VSVVLAQATIHAGSTDSVVIVNHSDDWLGYGGCSGLWPRKGTVFKFPPNTAFCLAYTPIAPHSRWVLQAGGYGPQFSTAQPGRYWMVFPYWASPHPPATHGPVYAAYTKLTVVR